MSVELSHRRVLVVEDQRVLAELMAAALGDEPDIERAVVAEDGPPALAIARRLAPDTALVDVQLPSMDGLELVGRLRELLPDVRVIVLTAQPRLDHERAALAGGAVGYLGKDAGLATVLAAVRGASVSEPARDPRLLARVAAASECHALSPREQQVLELLAAGQHAHAIAAQLGLSQHTVRGYVKSLLHKLGARSQLEAVALAARDGLVRVGAP